MSKEAVEDVSGYTKKLEFEAESGDYVFSSPKASTISSTSSLTASSFTRRRMYTKVELDITEKQSRAPNQRIDPSSSKRPDIMKPEAGSGSELRCR